MDVSTTSTVLVKAGLCLGFLFRFFLWRVGMGLRARLDAMESHSTAQQWKRQRCFRATSGLASLCSPGGTIPDGCRVVLEDDYHKQKERLGRLVSSTILQRSALVSKIKPSFLVDGSSTFDPLGFAHFGSHPHDAPPSSRVGEGYHLNDFQLNNDGTSSAIPSRQPSPSADIIRSLKSYSAATTLLHMQGAKPAEVPSSPIDMSVAAALVGMGASASEPANTCSIPSEPSTRSGLLCGQQMHGEIMSSSKETLCHAPQTSLTCSKTVSKSNFVGEVPKQEPLYKMLLEKRRAQDAVRFKELNSEIESKEVLLENLRRTRQALFDLNKRKTQQPSIPAALSPLSGEEEEEVRQALNGANRNELLVQHGPSNIDLSRAALQCLKPGAWLNDEVINLYMELLKERECREQKTYLKCHFFNTFFFNKLYKDAHSYDYKAVRRWTTLKKLGYSLLECDKIFVPIHKDIHWCLAVINLRDKKLQYLDSLKGNDLNALQALARYIKDEAKDKGAEAVDTSTWELECPKDIPEQMNGCDCGMFMIKYADFLSRGDELKFTQGNMEYFRKRTVLELLQLKAR